MKWFHHECSAKHDPKLQTLGAEFGSEGLGIYWGILEEIGQLSDTFHLKVSELSTEIDGAFAGFCQTSGDSREKYFGTHCNLAKIPRLSVKILAKNLFTSRKKLARVLEMCVAVGLFDRGKWLQYNVLYSPAFEHRADEYTRRHRKPSDGQKTYSGESTELVRTFTGQGANTLRRLTEHVPSEQEQTAEREAEGEKNRESFAVCSVTEKAELSTPCQGEQPEDEPYLIELTAEEFQRCCNACRSIVHVWNEQRSTKFHWQPGESELRKLFLGGDRKHKLALCLQAYNVQGERINYPALVLRAVRLMLKASQKTRISNPYGWLWSCLHGNGEGKGPWVQLLSAQEESDVARAVRRLVPSCVELPP